MATNRSEQTNQLKEQGADRGSGPLYHRQYWIDLPFTAHSPESLMAAVQADVNAFSPQIIAQFEKTKGPKAALKAGDRFLIRMTGPWNGPVKVLDVQPTSFTLKTLSGHPEAGQISFSTCARERGVRFVIESWARSHTTFVDFLYDKIPLVKSAQTRMWQLFLRNVARFAQPPVARTRRVHIHTEKFAQPARG